MNKKNLSRIIEACKEAGIESVKVYFDGGGDSGQIEDVSLVPNNFVLPPALLFQCMKNVWDEYTKKWECIMFLCPMELDEAVTEFVYEELDDTGVDW